jgi:hypothetical protein
MKRIPSSTTDSNCHNRLWNTRFAPAPPNYTFREGDLRVMTRTIRYRLEGRLPS